MKVMSASRDIVTVTMPQQVDSVSAAGVEKSMLAALAPGARVIVDGGEVSYMSAAGVRALATVLRRAEELQARIVFCRFTGAAADCLVVAGFAHLLDVAASKDEAADRLRPKLAGEADERLRPVGGTG